MYRVTLSFKDAGLFQRPRKPTGAEHMMLTPGGPINRKEVGAYADIPVDTILHACVVNMFRVLIGTRPVPTFQGATHAHHVASLSNAAERFASAAFIQVETGTSIDTRDNTERAIYEPQISNKAWDNAWSRNKVDWVGSSPLMYRVSWHSVESEFGPDLFAKFQKMVVAVLGEESLRLDMVTVFGLLFKAKAKATDDFCHLPGVSKFYLDTFINGKTSGQFFGHSGQHGGLNHWEWSLENRGLAQVNRRSGTITVDVDEDDVYLFDQGFGCATLLDGGVVKIENIEEADLDPVGKRTYKMERA